MEVKEKKAAPSLLPIPSPDNPPFFSIRDFKKPGCTHIVSLLPSFYTPAMYLPRLLLLSIALSPSATTASAKEPTAIIRKAAQRSTLDQPGTKPFHLRATLDPSRPDSSSKQTGEIEIWWKSPTEFRREVRCPSFHQIEIINGSKSWQKNEGDYFPEWLREIAVALIRPIPDLEQTIQTADDGDLKHMAGNTYFSWIIMSSNGTTEKGMGGSVAITDKTGLLFYVGGTGWGGLFENYRDFHGRSVPRIVKAGSPEVTASVMILEDLPSVPSDFFSTNAPGASEPLNVAIVNEKSLRANLKSADPTSWPSIKDGPLEGALTTEVVVDRTGQVREVGTIVSDNQALSEEATKRIYDFHFSPYLQNGVPIQVVSRITLSFKTVRPAGVENFDTARNYFERGRLAGFPAAGKGSPYVLHATFKAMTSDKQVQDGQYVDTWKSPTEWRREVTIGKSHFVRSQHGDTRYLEGDGPDENLLHLVMRLMEPIPAIDTFVESDWRMKRDTVDGVKTIRVLTGYESPQGELDKQKARAYWFDEEGQLRKLFVQGLEVLRSDFQEFDSAQVAKQIRVLNGGATAIIVKVTELSTSGGFSGTNFEIPKHKWQRAFTDEVR